MSADGLAGRSGPMLSAGLFGPLHLETEGCSLGPRDLGGAKPKQLLEVLLLERGRTLSKDSLADRLWGDSLPASIGATLETYVSIIRRRLGSARDAVVTVPGGYRLDPALVELDLDRFDRLAQLGVSGEPAERYPHLAAAVELGAEPLLADEPYAEWAQAVRAQYADRHLQALIQLTECCLALGRLEEAAVHADAALARDPLLERAVRAGMLARYALGDQARALAAYADLRAGLAAEFGALPAAETTQLSAAIRERAPVDSLLHAVPGRSPGIRFARNGDVRLAYLSFGGGEADVLFFPQFLTNLGATWDEPIFAGFLHRLGAIARVTLFDKRGSGLSDPVSEWPAQEERCQDIGAVLDAAGIQRAVLFGVCDGGPNLVRFAARFPERVAGLVLFATPVRLLACPGVEWGWSEAFFRAFLDSFDGVWMRGAGLEYMDPSLATDPRYRALFARFLRLGTSPGMARRLWESEGPGCDVRELLPEISAPTLVMTRRDDPWVAPANSRYLAEHIRNAQLLLLDGSDHEPWLGDTEPVLAALRGFLASIDRAAALPA